MSAKPRFGARLALSLVLCYSAPVAADLLLNAGGPLLPLLVYCTLVEGLFIARRFLVRRTAITVALGLVLLLGAFVVYAAIDITPGSAFLAWFKLVSLGTPGGTIAYMFCVDAAFFSSLFAGLLIGGDLLTAIFGYLFMNSVLTAIILESLPATAAAAALLLGFVVYRGYRRTKGARLAPAAAAVQLFLASAAVAVGATALMIPNGIVDHTFSLPLEGSVARLFPGFPFLYNVPGYGHSFNPSDLGGRPALTSRPVLRVVGPPGSTIYLRSAVYDTYTGTGWAQSEAALERARSPSPVFHRAAGGAPRTGGRTIHITVLIDFLATLPNTLGTKVLAPEAGELPPLDYGSEATGYVLSVPVTAGFRLVDRSGLPVDGNSADGASVGPQTALAHRSEYLQTGTVPEELRALADRLHRDSPVATVAAIRAYLAANYAYTLDVRRFRPGSNGVADFLFATRAGYCVQFASAFTLLARLDGVPSRYVTGFLVNIPERSDAATVTGLSAHSWSEVYLEGRWKTVEATPPMMPSSEHDAGYYRLFNPTGSAATRRQLEALMGARVPPPPPQQGERLHFPFRVVTAALVGLAAALVLLRALVVATLPRRVRVRRIVRRLLRRSRRLGLPDPSRQGWYAWAGAAGTATARRANMTRAAGIVHSLFFAARAPRRREERYLAAVDRRVRAAGRRRPGHSSPPLHQIAH